MKNIFAKAGFVLAASMTLAFAGCSGNNAATAKDPVIGSWQLSTVKTVAEDGTATELTKEDHQSYFADSDSWYEFKEDGTTVHHMSEAGTELEVGGTWKKTDTGYDYTDDSGIVDNLTYNAADDTLIRVFVPETTEEYAEADFIYARKK